MRASSRQLLRGARRFVEALEGPAVSEAVAACSSPACSSSAARGSAHRQPQRQLHAGATALRAVLPLDGLPEESLLDDAEAVRRSEVDVDVPLEEEGLLPGLSPSTAAGSGLAPLTDTISTLPLGEGLQQAVELEGRRWLFESGRLARLADGSCTLQVGNTTVLATAACGAEAWGRREPQLDVDYREKLFAVGRIPGTYNKREGAPKEHEVLAARRLDRALRPLLPRGFPRDATLFATVLSADGQVEPEVMAINATSAALTCSDIPWDGPVGAARVVLSRSGELLVNPPAGAVAEAPLSLLVAATAGGRVVMLEAEAGAGAGEVSEEQFLRALRQGVEEAQKLLQPQLALAAQTGRHKRGLQLAGADPVAAARVQSMAAAAVEGVLRDTQLTKTSRTRAMEQAKAALLQKLRDAGSMRTDFARVAGSGCVTQSDMEHAFQAAVGAAIRRLSVQEGLRCDGRGLVDTRPLHCQLDAVPVVHGSALFSAGETQCLATVTVGGGNDQQKVESLLGGEGSKPLFVHFTAQPYSTTASEASRLATRREMGHSGLVERALAAVMPSPADFPFALRLNADTLAADGGSAMAAVCAGALALTGAGVPLRRMVAGVAVGLLAESGWDGASRTAGGGEVGQAAVLPELGQYELLTDPQALELQLGDMSLRVAGTREGITACQLDARLPGGVPLEVLEQALQRAARARRQLLDTMEATLSQERQGQGPQFGTVTVPEGMVGRVIGTGGSMLREVEGSTGARVDVGSGGRLRVFAPTAAAYESARLRLLGAAGETIQEGSRYSATVTRLVDYGAMVEVSPPPGSSSSSGEGVRCLLHISEISHAKIRSVQDVLQVGQQLEVLCTGRDNKGNIKLSRKALVAAGAEDEALGSGGSGSSSGYGGGSSSSGYGSSRDGSPPPFRRRTFGGDR